MSQNSLSQLFQKWVARGRTRSATPAARKPTRLRVEEVEQRLAPAVLPVVSVSGTTTVANTGGASSPQVVADPLNPNTLVMVYTTGQSLQAQLSTDGGISWTNFRDVRGLRTNAFGNPILGNALFDPTASPNETNPQLVEYNYFSAPSIAFARGTAGATTIYMSFLQHNLAKTSGAVVVESFGYNRATQAVTQVDLDPAVDFSGSGTLTQRFNLRSTADNRDYVLYQWIDTAGNENRGLNPYIAVDNNLASFQDPSSLTSGPTDTLVGNGVYVAWNDDVTAPSIEGDNFAGRRPYTRNAVWLSEAVVQTNGRLNFSTPLPVNDGGHFTNIGGSSAQIVFSPSENNTNTAVTPGQMSVVFQSNNNTIIQDRSRPDGGVAGTPVVSSNYFRSENYNSTSGRINDATVNPNAADSPTTSPLSQFQVPVTFSGDPTFTTLADLNVTVALTHHDVSQLSLTLVAPDGTRIRLLNNQVDANGNTSFGNGNIGLPRNTVDLGVAGGTPAINNPTTFGYAVGTVFDNEAGRQINDRANVAPYIGSFRPENNGLSTFYGRSAAGLESTSGNTLNSTGNWVLEVTDYRNDRLPPGQSFTDFVRFFSLQFTSAPPNAAVNNTGLSTDRAVTGASTTGNAPDQTYPNKPLVSPTFGVGPGVSVAYDTSLGAYSRYSGRLYAAYTSGGGSNTDITLISSDDNGLSWSTPVRVNNDTISDNVTEGNRTQYQPTVTVDPVTGTVVVMWYDARNDAANARVATYVATSIDGGRTFSPQTYLNDVKTALDQLTRATVVLEPIPTNVANIPTATNPYGTGNRQALVAFGGVIRPFWTGNQNGGGSSIFTANVRTATGPRVVATDMGSVTADASYVNAQGNTVLYNQIDPATGLRRVDGFLVTFDRLIDANSFTPADVTVQFRAPGTGRDTAPSVVPVGSVEILDPTFPVTQGNPGGTPSATRFFVRFTAPQTAVGTYSWAVGPNVTDRIRSTTTAVYRSVDTPLAIPDGVPTGVTSTIAIQGVAGNVQNLQVGLNIRHTFDADLVVTLISPSGTRVLLSNRHGGSGNNFTNTRFRDNAANGIGDLDFTDANNDGDPDGPPFNGVFRPDDFDANGDPQSLADFSGEAINGNWRLLVQDRVGGEVGTLDSWSLTFLNGPGPGAGLPVTISRTSNAMDQDADALPGEAQNDVFTNPRSTSGVPFTLNFDSSTLPVILPGVHVVATAVPNQPATVDNLVLNQTNNQISVTFDRDVARFTPANVLRLTTPAGVVFGPFTVTPAGAAGPGGGFRTYIVGFPPQALSGSYTLEFGEDTAGNSILAANVPQLVTILAAPTNFLTVTFATAPAGFTTADVLRVNGPAGAVTPTSVTPVAGTGGRQFRINFATNQPAGQYVVDFTRTGTRFLAVEGTGQEIDQNVNAGLAVLRGTRAENATFSVATFQSNTAVPIAPAAPDPVRGGLTPSVTEATINIPTDFIITSNPTGAQQIRVTLNIDFPRDADLDIDLVSPAGSVVRLFTGRQLTNPQDPNNSANFINTLLQDRGNAAILAGQAPFTPANGVTAFTPQTPLAAFEGQSSRGVWRLRVTNNSNTTQTDPGQPNFVAAPRIRNFTLDLPRVASGTGLGEAVADRFSASFRIFTQNPTSPLTQDVWAPVGPAPLNETANSARVSAVAADPTDSSGNTVYVAVAGGGVWKTSDFLNPSVGGPHYQPLTDFGAGFGSVINGVSNFGSALNVSSLAVFPMDRNNPGRTTIFALTGEPGTTQGIGVGLLRSTDGGATWKVLDSRVNTVSAADNRISLLSDPRRDHFFVGSTGYKIVVDPNLNTDGKINVYMAISGGAHPGVWRSLDSGETWTLVRAGQATDVVLSSGSATPTGAGGATVPNGSLNRLYAGFQGEGVYGTDSALSAAGMTLLRGNTGNTSIRDISITGSPQVIPNNLGVTPNGAQGRVSLAVPALTGDALRDAILNDWLYALTPNGLYVTKDNGQTWTKARLPTTSSPNFLAGGFGTNDENKLDRTVLSSTYAQSIAVSPLNPNVVYIAGRTSLRVDITAIRDAQNFTFYNNSDNVGSALTQTQTPGGVVPRTAGARGSVYVGGPNSFDLYPSDFLNLSRDFNDPFNTSANSTIRVRGTGTNDINDPNRFMAGNFANDGKDVRYTNFGNQFSNSNLPDYTPGISSLAQNRFSTNTVHSAVPVIDPVTGNVRFVYGTDYGVFTGVDSGDGLGTLSTGIGFSRVVNFTRNGNLQVAQFTDGAVQSSQLAADLAGALFYGQGELVGFPVSTSNILSTGTSGVTGNSTAFGLDWRGPIGTGGLVMVDPTGTGTSFQFREPFDDGSDLNTTALSTDFFRVFAPGTNPAFSGGVGRTRGLIALGDNGSEYSFPRGLSFAVNPLNPQALLIVSNAGRVSRTLNQGLQWGPVGSSADFGGGTASALAFGALLNPQQPSQNSNFFYVGTNTGRVYVTTTGGAPYTDISAGLAGGTIRRIVPDPRVGSRDVYAITGGGVYFKADGTDAGTPWVNITGNLFGLTRAVFGDANDQTPALRFLSSLAVDWRTANPVPGDPTRTAPSLYVAGDGGVFKSKDGGSSWTFYPNTIPAASGGDGAPVDGGFLPNTHIMDLDLSIGDIDTTTGTYKAGGLNLLVATTYGRGMFAIRLDDALPAQNFISGPRVVALANPNTVGNSTRLQVDFSSQLDPISVTPANFRLQRLTGGTTDVAISSVSYLGVVNGAFRYELTFAAQTGAAAQYQLTVGYNTPPAAGTTPGTPSLFDPSGNRMNQDGDLINGEDGVDQFTRTLTLNGTGQTLVVATAPTSLAVNNPANVVLQIQDINGFVQSNVGGTLNVAVTPANGASVPTTVQIINGQAVLPVSFATVGGYTITASDAAATPRFNSTTFAIQAVAGQATTLVLSPVSSTVSTPPGTVRYTLSAFDNFGNPAAYNGQVSITSGGTAPATFVSTINMSGPTATFDVGVAATGTVTITAAAPGLTPSTATILVNPGPATRLLVSTSPGPFVANGGITVTVTAVDAAGNQTNVGLNGLQVSAAPTGSAFGTSPATPAFDASGVATFTVFFPTAGTFAVNVASGAASGTTGPFTVLGTPPVASPTEKLTGTFAVATGVDGSPSIQVYNASGQLISTSNPFPPGFNNEVDPGSAGFTGGIRVAVADVTGDDIPDYVVGTGPTITASVRVIDGATGQFILNYQPFGTFAGGVFVSVGDIDKDGLNDIVITPDEGGGPRVIVLRGGTTAGGGNFTKMADFFGIEDPGFRGGARAGVGDVNGDGFADVVVSAGFGGGPRVSIYDGAALTRGQFTHPIGDFFVFDDALRNGAYIAVGDVDGDGFGDIIAGAGPGGGPRVSVINGRTLLQQGAVTALGNLISNFFAGDTENRGGVRVAAKNLDGDRNAEILVGAGDGGGSGVTIYRGSSIATGGFDVLQGFDALAGYAGGVFVG